MLLSAEKRPSCKTASGRRRGESILEDRRDSDRNLRCAEQWGSRASLAETEGQRGCSMAGRVGARGADARWGWAGARTCRSSRATWSSLNYSRELEALQSFAESSNQKKRDQSLEPDSQCMTGESYLPFDSKRNAVIPRNDWAQSAFDLWVSLNHLLVLTIHGIPGR